MFASTTRFGLTQALCGIGVVDVGRSFELPHFTAVINLVARSVAEVAIFGLDRVVHLASSQGHVADLDIPVRRACVCPDAKRFFAAADGLHSAEHGAVNAAVRREEPVVRSNEGLASDLDVHLVSLCLPHNKSFKGKPLRGSP